MALDPAVVEEVWRAGRWPMTTRRMRRSYVALAAGLGAFCWMFVPLQLLGLLLSDDGRREILGAFALCFGLGLASLTAAVVLHRLFAPGNRAEDALKASGARVTGHVLKKRYAPSGTNIASHSQYLFAAEGPGGEPVFARVLGRNGIPLGTAATIAYDPERPGAGVVVESVSELKRAARRR